MSTSNQSGGTRYVFAGTSERANEAGVKTCPRCGEMLFSDMDVCYGCLYDFSKDAMGNRLPEVGKPSMRPDREDGVTASGTPRPPAPPSRQMDPLAMVELDELDDEPEDYLVQSSDRAPSALPPRHSKREAPSPEDTLDLSMPDATVVTAPAPPALSIAVSSDQMRVVVPLPPGGLSVGRDEANDIVLRSRSVSRRHLRIRQEGETVLVEDCGATNPALVRGEALSGMATLAIGEAVTVCGTTLEACL